MSLSVFNNGDGSVKFRSLEVSVLRSNRALNAGAGKRDLQIRPWRSLFPQYEEDLREERRRDILAISALTTLSISMPHLIGSWALAES